MDPIAGVEFVQGDFNEEAVLERLMVRLGDAGADLVISDMAPNLSGIADIDQPQSMNLVELALDMADRVLKPKGNFIAKAFQGEGFEQFVRECRNRFVAAVIRKPDASRARSREVYIVAKGYRG